MRKNPPSKYVSTKKTHPLARYREKQTPPLTVTEMAARLGVSKATVSRWETGARVPSSTFLPILARLTGVSIPSLMGIG